MTQKNRARCCSCANCLCCQKANKKSETKIRRKTTSQALRKEKQPRKSTKERRGRGNQEDSPSETSSNASGYESIPNVNTEELELIEVPKKRANKKSQEIPKPPPCSIKGTPQDRLTLSRQFSRTSNTASGMLNDAKAKEEFRRKLEALTWKKQLEKKWKERRGERLKQGEWSSGKAESMDEEDDKSVAETGRKDRELRSVWSLFNLSHESNRQLRHSYPTPGKKVYEPKTEYEKVHPTSLREPPSLEGKEDKEDSSGDGVGGFPGEYYLGPMKIAEAQALVSDPDTFKFYHRLPTKEFESEDYASMRDHLSLWIVYRNAEGRYRHYIVRQESTHNGKKKWVIRNYAKSQKKFTHFQDLLKHYVENPGAIEKAED
ncbi:hypothetical protein L596_028705 [Steinernema carpocapsae]|uniref:SH2 domain-containing protein n=1 Tax=Steinernema carpocapsae TaxID=34508 RepID=A0A4U5LZ56_STECR|nr:hypothetical protein L596_028705 [Steinernema carpocapsae]